MIHTLCVCQCVTDGHLTFTFSHVCIHVWYNFRIRAHEVKETESPVPKAEGALPPYLFDRQNVNRTKVLTNMLKQKRKEKAGKWQVPIPKVKAMTEDEMFKVLRTGKRKSNQPTHTHIRTYTHTQIRTYTHTIKSSSPQRKLGSVL